MDLGGRPLNWCLCGGLREEGSLSRRPVPLVRMVGHAGNTSCRAGLGADERGGGMGPDGMTESLLVGSQGLQMGRIEADIRF